MAAGAQLAGDALDLATVQFLQWTFLARKKEEEAKRQREEMQEDEVGEALSGPVSTPAAVHPLAAERGAATGASQQHVLAGRQGGEKEKAEQGEKEDEGESRAHFRDEAAR